jgi:hypothetical protein
MAHVQHSTRGFERQRYDTSRDSRTDRSTHTRDTRGDRRDR